MDPIYEGKAKRLYTTDNPDELFMEFKDDASAFDGMKKVNLTLIDFKLEFGRLNSDPSTIVLTDEISPDTCRLWDIETGRKMDKDRFRRGLGDVMESYAEVLSRTKDVLNG